MEDREFQNLLAIRSHLVTLLMATTAGTIGLAFMSATILSCILILSGIFFIIRIVVSLSNTEQKINISIRRKNGSK